MDLADQVSKLEVVVQLRQQRTDYGYGGRVTQVVKQTFALGVLTANDHGAPDVC